MTVETASAKGQVGGSADPVNVAGLAHLAGIVAGLTSLAVGDLVAWLRTPEASPLSLFATWVLKPLPALAYDPATGNLRPAAEAVAVTLVLVGYLALCALAGGLELRRRYAGLIVFGGLAAAGLAAATVAVPGRLEALVPALAGPLAGYLLLNLFVRRLVRDRQAIADLLRSTRERTPAAGTRSGAPDPSRLVLAGLVRVRRRRFLVTTSVVGGLAAAGAVTGRALVMARRQAAVARAKIQLPPPATPAPTPPPGAELNIDGLTTYVTPNEEFYRIDTAVQIPAIDAETWQLRITGLVDNEVTVSYAELMARPLVEHMSTLVCKGNPIGANPLGGNLIGNASWLGVPVRDLLAEAGPRSSADLVLSTSADGWSAGTPLDVLLDTDQQALLVVGMNGEILPAEHGFPVRLVVPSLYGDVSATKWLTELKVTTSEEDEGYWTSRGWSEGGEIKIGSRIDVPRPTTVPAGTVVVAGMAWAQDIGISRVEVRVDDGGWRDATLADTVGPDTWRQWQYIWDASPGRYRLTVRATDADGTVQTEKVAPPAPSGATGWHSITIRVRRS